MKRYTTICIILFLIAQLAAPGWNTVTAGPAADWTLVWSDEFSGPAGQSPDAAKWDYDIGTGWGNQQLEYDTDRPSNVSLDGDGNLAIIAREESYMGQPYTSARIVTRGLYETAYGRIEARIKLPIGQGIWPAFWMLGSDITTVGWPQCGEIDIMEYRGQEPNINHGTVHGPGYFGGGGITQSYVLPSGSFNDDFHLFAIEWEEQEIRWYVDGNLYHSVTPSDLGGNEWVFDHPFYIILNIAVGGTFVGSPDASTVFPQTMLVDYVRVYTDVSSDNCCSGTRGDMNFDGVEADPVDLSYLADFLFSGGTAPLCAVEGDLNADGNVANPVDLSFLVDFLFAGGLAPQPCPVAPDYVFIDDYDDGVTYQAFGGSKLDAVQIDAATTYAGTHSLRITVPDVGDPSGSYSGGAFTANFGRDLTAYNALTFQAKASRPATLDVAGIGNDNTGTSLYTAEVTGLPLTTSWQEYVIPIPLADKLIAEDGLFYFAEGPEDGTGYTIWIDEIKFDYRSGITNPQPSIPSQTLNLVAGESADIGNGSVTFDVDGSAVTVSAMPGYFDFQTSNASVASVNTTGQVEAVGGGTAAITADLGSTPVTGTITVNVTVPPDQPASPAPVPTHDPADVIALFSDAYSTVNVDTWSAPWDQADVEDFAVGLDNTRKYTNLIFAGIEFTSTTIDASGMTHFQMDVWTPDPTAAPAVFRVKLVDFGANGVYDGSGDDVEHELTFDHNTMATGSWITIDVPLSDFTNLVTREHLAQLIISGDPGTVYVDNVLLHR